MECRSTSHRVLRTAVKDEPIRKPETIFLNGKSQREATRRHRLELQFVKVGKSASVVVFELKILMALALCSGRKLREKTVIIFTLNPVYEVEEMGTT